MNILNTLGKVTLMMILLLALALAAGCSQEPAPAPAASATTAPPTATAPAQATATRPGSQMRVPFRSQAAGLTLFHPPSWSAELDPGSGMLLLAPEASAEFRDISNALIVAGPSSVVGQSIVAGEEALTEARADAAFQFMLVNFAGPFVPDMELGEEITIVEAGQKTRASVPYSGTTVQEIPVSGTLNLIVENGQVAGALTLTTGQDTLTQLLGEMVGSISLSAPAGP